MEEIKMYTVAEIAEILSLAERTIRRYIAEGKLNSIKVMGNVRITQEELDRHIKPTNIKGDK